MRVATISQPRQWSEHAVLALVFVASRLALYLAGLSFNFSLDWMWLSDPADLQDRLLQTLYYFHAFPPGMDLLSGILLKLGGAYAAVLAQITFWVSGLVLVQSLFYLARISGLSFRASLVVTFAFSLLPQSIYFEHLYLYEEPVAAMLCLSVALFHAALSRQSVRLWLAFFTVCALIGVTRSTFHLLWFVVMTGVALWFNPSDARRRILLAATAPAVLLIGLYVKNLVVFDTFGAFTYGPSSYAHVTVSRLPDDVREQQVREHKLSPFATLSPYAGPREYLQVFSGTAPTHWPSQLTQLERPTVHAPNFNHWVILEANRQRNFDAWFYMRTQPIGYATNVLRGMRDLFAPSTEWHPYTGTERSPHYEHRRVLGGYESLANRVMHGFPVAPVGVYAFLPLAMIWTAGRAWQFVRSKDRQTKTQGAMLVLCLLNIGYVVAISSAFTFLESSRYRYQVESLIWLVTAFCVADLSARALQPQLSGKTVSGSHFS
jgi:hypothetical protein